MSPADPIDSAGPGGPATGTERRPHITRLVLAVAGPENNSLKAALNGDWYRACNPDVVGAGLDPYAHWVARGAEEGRLPCQDILSLLEQLMRERMPSAAPAEQRPADPAQQPRAPAPAPAALEKIRVVCATRLSQEAFLKESALGRSLALRLPHAVELRVFANNKAGLAHVYNTAIADSRSEPAILLFIHDDIHLCDFFWADRLRQALNVFHVVGLAGTRRRHPRQPSWCNVDEGMISEQREFLSGTVGHGSGFPPAVIDEFGPSGQRVRLLDGLFLAAKSSILLDKSVRFDERFDFDFYDLDFCRTAEEAGLSLGTWPISAVHESTGGYVSDRWRRNYGLYLQKWGD